MKKFREKVYKNKSIIERAIITVLFGDEMK